MVNTIRTGQTTFKQNEFTVILASKVKQNYKQYSTLVDAQTQVNKFVRNFKN